MNNQPRSLEIDRKSTFAMFSLLAGILSLLILVLTLLVPPPTTAAQQLAFFTNNQTGVIIFEIIVLVWSVFSIPFVVGLGTLLRVKSRSLALTATIFSSVGILLLGFVIYAANGALLSIVAAGNVAPSSADAIYQVAIWGNLRYLLTDPPLMAWGLGQVLFGWLAWKSNVLPNWLSVLGMIGGIATVLASLLLPAVSSILIFVTFVSFAVWGLTTGILLLRSRRKQQEPSTNQALASQQDEALV